MLFHSDRTSVNIINLPSWHSEEAHWKGGLTVRPGALENEKEPWMWWLMILKTEKYLKIRPQHWAPGSHSEHCGCSSGPWRGRGGVRPGPNDFSHPLLPAKGTFQASLQHCPSPRHFQWPKARRLPGAIRANPSKPLHSTVGPEKPRSIL